MSEEVSLYCKFYSLLFIAKKNTCNLAIFLLLLLKLTNTNCHKKNGKEKKVNQVMW